MTKRRGCSSKRTFHIYKIVSQSMVHEKPNSSAETWSAENLIRSGSIPTNTSFFFPVGLYKRLGVSFLVSHNKIIRTMISSTAQWDRIGTVAGPSNAFGIDPYRHQFHFPSWFIKKPLGFRF